MILKHVPVFILLFYSIPVCSQNVGIGTTSPLMNLHIVSADSAVALFENQQNLNVNISNAVYFKTGNNAFPYTGAIKTTGQGTSTARLGLFTFASSSANGLRERMSITDAGNVGIGNINPLVALHVTSSVPDVGIFENSQPLIAGTANAVYFKTGSSFSYTGAIKTIGQSGSTARLGFFTFASSTASGLLERMSIIDNGNVGIGLTTPNASLSVTRGFGSDGTAVFMGTNYNSHFNYSAAEDTYIRGGKLGSSVYINDLSTGNVSMGSGSGRVIVNGSVSMPIRHADFFSSSYVFVFDNDFTIVIDFTLNGNIGRQIILPFASGRAGVIYHIIAINLNPSTYIPANIVEGAVGGTYIGFINSAVLNFSVQSDGANWFILSSGG